ncbi:MAG: hypothetical protein GY847_37645 [Proteobacteria bacterium]|nr:hypothetical protein [Pseudomonadota bacterium]
MTKITTIAFFSAVVLASSLAIVVGCDSEETTTYGITVRWEIGGIPACKSPELEEKFGGVALEFETIKITVYDDEGDEEPVQNTVSVLCREKEYTIYNLERGEYFVEAEAWATHDDMELPYFLGTETIVVPAADEEVYPISLRLNSGSVDVAWDFERGGCQNDWNNVENVIITLRGDNNTETSDPIPCVENQWSFEGLSWDLYTLTVEGFNEQGEPTHRGVWGNPDSDADADSDTDVEPVDAGADAAIDTDEDTDSPSGDRLDVRPGSHIRANDALVVLKENSV